MSSLTQLRSLINSHLEKRIGLRLSKNFLHWCWRTGFFILKKIGLRLSKNLLLSCIGIGALVFRVRFQGEGFLRRSPACFSALLGSGLGLKLLNWWLLSHQIRTHYYFLKIKTHYYYLKIKTHYNYLIRLELIIITSQNWNSPFDGWSWLECPSRSILQSFVPPPNESNRWWGSSWKSYPIIKALCS